MKAIYTGITILAACLFLSPLAMMCPYTWQVVDAIDNRHSIRAAKDLVAQDGRSVGEVLAERYRKELELGRARWTADNWPYFYANFELLIDAPPNVEACDGKTVWWRAYRWRIAFELVVANTDAALTLTPELAPTAWNEDIASGCADAPMNEEEAALFAEESRTHSREWLLTRCKNYNCD